ncbi:uncharacterized protein LOC141853448 [Brevipalpus obovatus]|uniref:uncharacterized protein LOC141853448 n=1 Tax=Brevipalpus obovatus TaxID=246614 RepID=UPI003D9E6522
MDAVFSDDGIFDRILNEIPINDLPKFRVISKRWNTFVTRKLKAFACHHLRLVAAESDPILPFNDYGKSIHQLRSIINHVNHGFHEFHSSKSGILTAFARYFNNGLKCIPKFSLIVTNLTNESDRFYQPSTNYPVIVIHETWPIFYPPSQESEILESISKFSCIYSINTYTFNNFFSNLKVTITDWNDPMSLRPIMTDRKNPVMSCVYFGTGWQNLIPKDFSDFLDLLNLLDIPVFGGSQPEYFPDPQYYDPKIQKFRRTSCISISFAGRNVKSANFRFNFEPKRAKKRLQNFKKTLDFDTDHESEKYQTIGFFSVWEQSYAKNACQRIDLNSKFQILQDVFPHVTFMGIKMQNILAQSYDSDFNILLIHLRSNS